MGWILGILSEIFGPVLGKIGGKKTTGDGVGYEGGLRDMPFVL